MSAPGVEPVSDIPRHSPATAARLAFGALLLRDLVVLRKNLNEFVPRTVLQPFLLVFTLTYVFPKIGQGVGGRGPAAGDFSTLFVAGIVGFCIFMQGVQSVSLPMVQEFGYTREIEDRVQAPLPIALVAFEKITAGACNCFLASLIVFPIAALVPWTPVHLEIDWLVLVTLLPIACFMAASLGLAFGTRFSPRTVPLLFGIVLIPLVFLGATYYSWSALEPIPWLQVAVLVNPLVYINEGFRAALTPADHMSLWVVYPATLGFLAACLWLGVRGFTKRVLS
jgi:ABC-2 type transport system permease protein